MDELRRQTDRLKPAWLMLLSGVFLGVAYPPIPLGIFAYVSFIPFFILFEEITGYWKGIRAAYFTFLVFNVITLYWVGGFTHMKDVYLMIAGAATTLGHALFFLITIPPFLFLKKQFGYRQAVLAFPVIWVAFEFLHSLSEYSFPWLILGNTQTYDLPAIQFASITGVYGISFWIMSINVMIYLLGTALANRRWTLRSPQAIAVIVLLVVLYSAPRIAGYFMMEPAPATGPDAVRISVLQPNIDPFDKWTRSPAEQIVHHESLTVAAAALKPDLVLWSETAIPTYILHPVHHEEYIGLRRMVDTLGVNVLSGIPHMVYYPDAGTAPRSSRKNSRGERYDSYNASMLLRPQTDEIQIYSKMRLVPYAERVPYSDFLSFLNAMQWNFGLGGWGIGKDTTIFYFHTRDGRRVQFANFICYESIYPGFDAAFVRKGAEFITVITNDSWWGKTSGAYQHKEIGVLRAVENRRWLVQCANGGVSCFIDPYGRIVQSADLYTKAILTGEIVPRTDLTFYTRTGDWLAEGCLMIGLFLIAAGLGNKFYRRTRQQQEVVNEPGGNYES